MIELLVVIAIAAIGVVYTSSTGEAENTEMAERTAQDVLSEAEGHTGIGILGIDVVARKMRKLVGLSDGAVSADTLAEYRGDAEDDFFDDLAQEVGSIEGDDLGDAEGWDAAAEAWDDVEAADFGDNATRGEWDMLDEADEIATWARAVGQAAARDSDSEYGSDGEAFDPDHLVDDHSGPEHSDNDAMDDDAMDDISAIQAAMVEAEAEAYDDAEYDAGYDEGEFAEADTAFGTDEGDIAESVTETSAPEQAERNAPARSTSTPGIAETRDAPLVDEFDPEQDQILIAYRPGEAGNGRIGITEDPLRPGSAAVTLGGRCVAVVLGGYGVVGAQHIELVCEDDEAIAA
mgnify:FL=1